MNKEEQKQLIIDIMDADAKDGLYAREHNSPIIQELIDETTPKELEKINKEMTQTAVEWLEQELELPPSLWVSVYTLLEQAKEMENQQRIDAIKNELKLIGNYFDVSKLETKEQGHHIRFTNILKDRFDYYDKTYGGNK
jgi:hypothetical protein